MNNDDKHKQAKQLFNQVVTKKENYNPKTDQIDRIITHPLFGLILFAGIMIFIFTVSQNWIGPLFADWLTAAFDFLGQLLLSWMNVLNTSPFISGLILEGILGGFAAVAGFLPLIMVLFFFLQLLEDSGYMARVAIVMDRYFKKIGLSGKSIIPMYVGTACSIPAIMASRTIKNEQQRRMTILLTPFVPCGAKLPVIALFISVFFTNQGWMTGLTYFLAILVILLAGVIMRFLLGVKMDNFSSYHFVELPDYQWPPLRNAFKVMLSRGLEFIIKAGTIIVFMNGILYILSNFNFQLMMVSNPSESILRYVSEPIAFLLTPLGFGVWGLAAAAILGFIAKEEVVGALAVIFLFSVTEDFGIESIEATRQILMTTGGLTAVSAFAYMAFNLFTPPCFAAIGAMHTELNNRKWTFFAVLYQLLIGYTVSLIIYQFGTLLFLHELTSTFLFSMIYLGVVTTLILVIGLKQRRQQNG